MCAILGIFDQNSISKAAIGLEVMKERGIDGFGVYDGESISINTFPNRESDFCIAHRLHSIIGFLPQPLKKKGVIAANNEIYNWLELKEKYNLKSRNDSELMLDMLDEKWIEAIKEFDGVYAFAYYDKGSLILARDILGVKPLFFSRKPFAFASERKALLGLGYEAEELNPRKIAIYKDGKLSFRQRKFFSLKPEHKMAKEEIKDRLLKILEEAVRKRVPQGKFGLLFSGGIDSTIIAILLKRLGADFTCYASCLDGDSEDMKYAKEIAQRYNLDLKVSTLSLENAQEYLRKVVPLIEDSNVVKAGVALTFHAACKAAKEDGIKVIYSGLGADELFAGYARFKKGSVNKDSLSILQRMYENDLYRDDVVTMNNNLELRLPFLDKKFVEFALKIPEQYKLSLHNKSIIREIALDLGVDERYSFRKKKAAQYGSNFDKAIERLSKKKGFKTKSSYLDSLLKKKIMDLAVLFSGGKDSCYAMHIMHRQNYNISCLITLKSKNPESYMFHTPAIDLAKMQAEALGIPIIEYLTDGKKESELKDLKKALAIAKRRYRIEGVVTGALFSNYQRERIDKAADGAGLRVFSPLWHKDQRQEMLDLLDEGFEIIFTAVAAYGLDKSWLGRKITKGDVQKLDELSRKFGVNIAGEGGEFESLVLDCPMFKKKMMIDNFELKQTSKYSARLESIKASFTHKH